MNFPVGQVTMDMTAAVSKIRSTVWALTSVLTTGSWGLMWIEPLTIQSESIPHVFVSETCWIFCFTVATTAGTFFSFCVFTFGPWYPFLEVFILLVSFFRVVRILVPLLKLLVIFLSFGLQGVWIFCSPHCDHPHCLLSSLSNFPFLHLQPLPSEQWLWCWCCWAVQ